MADKLSKGSYSSTEKCVGWYWCDRDAGQSYGNTKNYNIDNKTKTKKKKLSNHIWKKKKLYANSTEMYNLLL